MSSGTSQPTPSEEEIKLLYDNFNTPAMQVYTRLATICRHYLYLCKEGKVTPEDELSMMAAFDSMRVWLKHLGIVVNFLEKASDREENAMETTREFCQWLVNFDFNTPDPEPDQEPLTTVEKQLSDKVEALTQKTVELRGKVQAIIQKLGAKEEELEEEQLSDLVELLRGKVQELTQKLVAKEEEVREQEEETLRFMGIAQEQGGLVDENNDLELALEASEGKLDALQEDFQSLSGQFEALQGEKEDAEETANYYAEENQDLKRRIQILEEENADLKRPRKLPVGGTHVIHGLGTIDQRTVPIVEQEFTDAQPEITLETYEAQEVIDLISDDEA